MHRLDMNVLREWREGGREEEGERERKERERERERERKRAFQNKP